MKQLQVELKESSEAVLISRQSNQIVICKSTGCHDMATNVQGFCRLHYLASWKKLKTKEAKKRGKELEVYLNELGKRFPEEFLEKLRGEIEDMSEREVAAESSDESEKTSLFDPIEDGDDMDTIIKGLKVEDF